MSRIQLPTDRVGAPRFPREFAWVNTDRPLRLDEELKGSVVVLDFWTYCCINCMHILPDLAYIEHKYAGRPVVVIGVHSAKFDNEGDERNILQACQRYNIGHPVIVDQDHEIWSAYSVRSWPTLMIIDPAGKVVGALSGEGNREVLDQVVAALLVEAKSNGTLASAPPAFERKSRVPATSGLAFPGKVLADPLGRFLFISDSNHDRIIIATPQGRVISVAGSGVRGNADGPFASAQFHNPQGVAFDGDHLLYVADTDNHLIRKLDLTAKIVETISGTGEQVYDRVGGQRGRAQGLNSPWDLALVDSALYIAMAGPHQLWRLDLGSGIAEVWAGSGREDLDDGTGTYAALAQPSGIVRKGDWLYFVDSEVSALRKVSLQSREVVTLIGTGLFDFGDRDGTLSTALLQHPLGVTVHGDDILIADTYNHKIRRVNEPARKVTSLVGGGAPLEIASAEGMLNLYEPGGLSSLGDTLYIADTNHDRIVAFSVKDGSWSELRLTGLQSTLAKSLSADTLPVTDHAFRPGSDLLVRFEPRFEPGIHLNPEAPLNFAITSESSTDSAIEGLATSGTLPVEVRLPAALLTAGGTLHAMLSLAYCTDGNAGSCVPVTLGWRIRLNPDGHGPDSITLSERVTALK